MYHSAGMWDPQGLRSWQNAVGKCGRSKARILDYCLMIERHPGNVDAPLFGDFVGTYLNESNNEAMARKEVSLSEILPAPAGGIDTGLKNSMPSENIEHHIKFRWSPDIEIIVVVPDSEVCTAKAREVFPKHYSRQDVTFNCNVLPSSPTPLGNLPRTHP